MKSFKIPKEIVEVFYEKSACDELAAGYDDKWIPSLKAIYYKQKAIKAHVLAWRALSATYPTIQPDTAVWIADLQTGLVTMQEEALMLTGVKVKKTRTPRKPKVAPITTTEGESK